MRKAMMVLTVLALALSARAMEFAKGDQALKIYYSHEECQVLTPANFLAKFAEFNHIPNTDEAFRRLQAGQNYLIPGLEEKVEAIISQPVVETVEVEGHGIQVEDVVPRHELALVSYDDLSDDDYIRIYAQIEYDNYVVELESEVQALKQKLVSADKFRDRVISQQEKEIKGLEQQLAQKQQEAEAIALSNNGSYSLSKIIPVIPISTAYAIGSVGIIILLLMTVVILYRKVSQLKNDSLESNSDRLRQIQEHYRQQMEETLASKLKPLTDKNNLLKRNNSYMRHLLEERGYFFFQCPDGTVSKASRQPVDDIILKVVERPPNSPALVEIPGISDPVPARPALIEAALRSKEYQKQNNCIVLPEPEIEQPTKEIDIAEPINNTHSPKLGIPHAAAS